MHAAELIGVGRTSLFSNHLSVFGVLLSAAVVGESFGIYPAVVLVLVLGGMMMAEQVS